MGDDVLKVTFAEGVFVGGHGRPLSGGAGSPVTDDLHDGLDSSLFHVLGGGEVGKLDVFQVMRIHAVATTGWTVADRAVVGEKMGPPLGIGRGGVIHLRGGGGGVGVRIR